MPHPVFIYTPGQKFKTILKNEEIDSVYNFFNYENQIYERLSSETFKFKIRNLHSIFICILEFMLDSKINF